MSDPNFASEERWLRGAIRAEEAALPVRLRPAELGRRWAVRRRWRIVRRLELGAAAVVIAAVGLGAIWSFAHQGQPLVIQPPIAGPVSPAVAGPVYATATFATGPGLSVGRATLTLSQPRSASASFDVGCGWSVRGHVVGLSIGKQQIGGDYPFLRWKMAFGPKYQIEIVEPDQSTFTGRAADYASQAAADGRSGSITFTDLTLNTGDPSTAPRRSGTFTWTCQQPATLGAAGTSLPSPVVDEQGVPALWILQNGSPVRRAVTGCPVHLDLPGSALSASCSTADWWASLESMNSTLEVAAGDSLAFALDGWTVTSADVVAMHVAGASQASPVVGLHPILGGGTVTFSPPGPGDWYVHFTVEAARDDGSTLQAEYAYPISVP